jgi:hypothetical protein
VPEAIEPFAADQAVLLAANVLLDAEIQADVVKDQLQRPQPPIAGTSADGAADVAVGAGSVFDAG